VKIVLTGAGKKFNSEWIFRDLSYVFESGNAYAVLGRNGSGKSTLLQVVAGNIHPTAGEVAYSHEGKPVPVDGIFRHLAIVAPYQELIDEFTLREMVEFHFKFKKPVAGNTVRSVIERIGFRDPGKKAIHQFSSGMKQRVKLVLALLSEVSIVLLDEPTMNLDDAGSQWYLELVNEWRKDRIMVVCSNLQKTETAFCKEHLHIEDFKP
jgi:ABC-type multidrug transport system ATPase subunit